MLYLLQEINGEGRTPKGATTTREDEKDSFVLNLVSARKKRKFFKLNSNVYYIIFLFIFSSNYLSITWIASRSI